MFVIVGLGNPTLVYEGTRHNAGFCVIDLLSEKYHIPVETHKNRALIGKGMAGGRKVMLAKPQTYMNLSGESIRGLMDYFKFDPERELLVIYDDIDLDVGQIRIRKKGSAGGHNGMKNMILHLGTSAFPRIRIGIGKKPERYDLKDYVLSRFSGAEKEIMREAYAKAAEAAEMIVDGRIEEAMNTFNCKTVAKEA